MMAVTDKGEISTILDTGPPRPIGGHAVWKRRGVYVKASQLTSSFPTLGKSLEILGKLKLPLNLSRIPHKEHAEISSHTMQEGSSEVSRAEAGGAGGGTDIGKALGVAGIADRIRSCGFRGLNVPSYSTMRGNKTWSSRSRI